MDGWMVLVVVDFCALGGRCARRDWHTGKRKGEGKGGKAKILGFGPWSLVLLVTTLRPRFGPRDEAHAGVAIRILVRVFGHLSTAFVHWGVFFR